MRAPERYKAVQTIARFLAPMREREADVILRVAGAPATPSGWGAKPAWEKEQGIATLLARLTDDQVLTDLRELASGTDGQAPAQVDTAPLSSPSGPAEVISGPIFVVHGHARAILHEAVRVLERGTGRDVIVLHEQANSGRTILEKFEDHAQGAAFAVVLLTGDDVGGARTDARAKPRGRQNVIFELGFFFGKLGRQRVAVLLEAGVEQPSDIDGLVYIALDEHGGWKQALAKELESAAIPVDRSRIP